MRRSGDSWHRVRSPSGTEQQDWRFPECDVPKAETSRRTLEQMVRCHLLSVGLKRGRGCGGAWAHLDGLSGQYM